MLPFRHRQHVAKLQYAMGVRRCDALLRRFETELARLLCPMAVVASYDLSPDMSPSMQQPYTIYNALM